MRLITFKKDDSLLRIFNPLPNPCSRNLSRWIYGLSKLDLALNFKHETDFGVRSLDALDVELCYFHLAFISVSFFLKWPQAWIELIYPHLISLNSTFSALSFLLTSLWCQRIQQPHNLKEVLLTNCDFKLFKTWKCFHLGFSRIETLSFVKCSLIMLD